MSGNGILDALNPLNMIRGAQRLTGREAGLHSIALTLAFFGFVALQVAGGAFGGEDKLDVPVIGTIDVDTNTGLLALGAAALAFIAAFQLGWNNIPDVSTNQIESNPIPNVDVPQNAAVDVRSTTTVTIEAVESTENPSNRSGIDNA